MLILILHYLRFAKERSELEHTEHQIMFDIDLFAAKLESISIAMLSTMRFKVIPNGRIPPLHLETKKG